MLPAAPRPTSRRRAATALFAAALLVVGACAQPDDESASSTSTDEPGPVGPGPEPGEGPRADDVPVFEVGEIDWDDCGDGAECGTLEVPLDHADPEGDTIDLALSRHRAGDDDERIGVLLANPGGPGAGGTYFGLYAEQIFSNDVTDRFDVVGFDPRGTGESARIDCGLATDDLYHLDPTPDDAGDEADREDVATEMAESCVDENGELLEHVSTVDAARDLDLIRRALGEEQISYVGYSYGTLLGATYADLYPDRVRAMVLDGAVDPSLDRVQQWIDQARGAEEALDAFFEDCATRTRCDFAGPGDDAADLAERFDALMATIDADGLAADDDVLGPGEAHLAVFGALFSRDDWPDLATSLARAEEGDGERLWTLHEAYVGGMPDLTSAYWAITALDGLLPIDPAELDEIVAAAPRLGPAVVAENVIGPWWPVAAVVEPRELRAAGAPPIVVVSTRRDPATPYEAGVALAEMLESGTLISYDGDGHTVYASGLSTCVDEAVDAYLVDLEVPEPDLDC